MFPKDVSDTGRKRGRSRRQLPPGRHGLSRSFVAQNQRERIIAAVAAVCAREGYLSMSVEDIIAEAGVSRRTFYEHFKNKEHVFLAAYDEVAGQVLNRVTGAIESAGAFPDGARAGLGAFLSFLASEPEFARMCIVEVLAAGPEAVARRDAAMRAFAGLIGDNATRFLPDRPPVPSLVAETIVGGIYEVVYARIVRGEGDKLMELVPELVYSVLLPYLGVEAAADGASKASGATRR